MGVYSVTDYIIYLLILVIVLDLMRRFLFPYIKLDRKFIILISPYMFFGIFIRLLADVGFFERSQMWNITPGVYILCVAIGLIGIILGLLLEKITGVEYWIPPFLIGLAGALYTGFHLFTYIAFPERIVYPPLMAAAITLFFKVSGINPFNKKDNLLLIFAHMLDASSTFIAYDFYGFQEEHLLPRFLIESLGGSAFVMIPAKLVIVLLVIYALDNYKQEDEDEILYRMLKVLVFILGIGPGTRNTMLPALSL
ncbi:MAG: DUF63 family protein [Candidatus Altiarchaeota archaeon]|nr:DUF63 family protein [Candidatus Altiarchaeota archaeon]